MMIYRGTNETYQLSNALGRGGEGCIYEISGRANIVAKIYHPSKLSTKNGKNLESKIRTMIEQPVSPYLNNVLLVTWPLDILTGSDGKFAGYVMPRVTSKHHIYAARRERERSVLFPHYTWRTALTIAYNLALTVDMIHKSGAVIGDFNSNNIMIDGQGHVTLIDTDSYNITNIRTNTTYKCGVGISEVLAPELQGRDLSLESSKFTKESDNFSLAIHVFMLLMNNCHPFGCMMPNSNSSSTSNAPEAKNICAGYCPYISSTGSSVLPNDAPSFNMLPQCIQDLFKRAFSYDVYNAVKREMIMSRPSAKEWKDALIYVIRHVELKVCAADSSHIYPAHNHNCPWCLKAANRLSTFNTLRGSVANPRSNIVTVSPNQSPCHASGGTNASKVLTKEAFWAFSMLLVVLMEVLLSIYVLQGIYAEVFNGDETLSSIGIIGGLISGIIGTVLYNSKWASGASFGMYKYEELLLSVLIALAFTVGFVIAMGIIYILICILFYLLVGVFIVTLLAGIAD